MKLYNNLFLIILTGVIAVVFTACSSNSFTPDFSKAPPPFNRSDAIGDTTLSGGVEIFVIKQGDGPFEVTSRDRIQVRFTGRTGKGKIFDTTYRTGSDDNTGIFGNLTPFIKNNTQPPVKGFRRGLFGMKEGEKRIIQVPPSMGYQNSRIGGTNGFDLRSNILVYDVELVKILQPFNPR